MSPVLCSQELVGEGLEVAWVEFVVTVAISD